MFLFLFYIPTHSVCWDRVVEIRSGRVSFSECSCWTKQGWIKGWTFITAQHNKRVKLEKCQSERTLSLSLICSSFDGVWGSGSFETSVPHDLHYCLRWRRLFLTLRLLRHSPPLRHSFYLVPFKYPFSTLSFIHTCIASLKITPFLLLPLNVKYSFGRRYIMFEHLTLVSLLFVCLLMPCYLLMVPFVCHTFQFIELLHVFFFFLTLYFVS